MQRKSEPRPQGGKTPPRALVTVADSLRSAVGGSSLCEGGNPDIGRQLATPKAFNSIAHGRAVHLGSTVQPPFRTLKGFHMGRTLSGCLDRGPSGTQGCALRDPSLESNRFAVVLFAAGQAVYCPGTKESALSLLRDAEHLAERDEYNCGAFEPGNKSTGALPGNPRLPACRRHFTRTVSSFATSNSLPNSRIRRSPKPW